MADQRMTDASRAAASDGRDWWTPARRNYVLFVLCIVGVFNFIDRQIIAILLEPIKRDLGVSDAAMGLLSGIAFSAFYVTAGIPLARLADRGVRRSLIAACLAVWSAATALCGFVQSFAQLAIARIGVAGGEAGAGPASQSLLSDLYPVSQRATVIGVLMAAQAIGIALGLFFGGWLNTSFDWRTAFVVVGLPGLLLALIVRFTVAEPPRGMSERARGEGDDEVPTLRDIFRIAIGSPVLRLLLFIAMACSFAGYAILGWGPAFFIRVHGLSTMQVGLWMGLSTALGLFIGNILAGRIADRVSKGNFATYMTVAGSGTILAAPFGILFTLAEDVTLALAGLFAAKLCMSFWLPPTYAVAVGLVAPRMRATITALLTFCTTLVGTGLGPVFIGFSNDLLAPRFGQEAIRYSLLMAQFALLLCGILCFFAARALRRQQG